MRRITYLQKSRSSIISTIFLSIPILNVTQTRRLVRKCDSSREIGITERVSEGGLLKGHSRHYSTAPANKGVAVHQAEATRVGGGEKKLVK
jgi:hypothetical protein